jgi:hypothetical protein
MGMMIDILLLIAATIFIACVVAKRLFRIGKSNKEELKPVNRKG